MTVETKFPTPDEIRAEQEAAAAAEVNEALAAIRSALNKSSATDVAIAWRWRDPARRVVTATLNRAGWSVTFGSDKEDGPWCRVSAKQERRSYPPGA